MSATRRPFGVFWLLGIFLLVGSAAGGSWVLYSQGGAGPALSPGAAAPPAPSEGDLVAVGIGYVDARHGLLSLYPVQPGRVTAVPVEENQTVEAGAPLVVLEKEQAELLKRRTEADLGAAKVQLEQARKLIEQQRIREELQKLAIAVAQAKVGEAETALARRKELRGLESVGVTDKEVKIAQYQLDESHSGVAAEQKKLEELRLNDPALSVQLAEKAVAAKQAQLDEAQKAVAECELRAPVKGTVLRVQVGKGEVLGPQPKQPAIIFAPDEPRVVRAELDQEIATRVRVGQRADIEDNTKSGERWTGRVEFVAAAYMTRRQQLQEPIQVNTSDSRLLECLVTLDPSPSPPRYGQSMRVRIHGSPNQ